MSWQLSTIWSWDAPVGMFLSIGLYGTIPVYFSQSQLTAAARRLHSSFLTGRLDYELGRETLFRGSLGSGGNVCTMPVPLLFDESRFLALWSSPYTWWARLYIPQCLSTQTRPCRSCDLVWLHLLGASTCFSPQF
jgi:hypothetical protein